MAKADILKALSEFKDPSLCRHNSYSDSLKLDDERINGSDIDCFLIFGEQLPFTGRGSELDLLANRIERNISIWSRWRNGKPETADEISKRTYEHPAVATGPGRGKTTLMQRGMLQLMRTKFKDRWSGRSFSWDLVNSSPTDTEVRLTQDHFISGFQSFLGLRLLHQAIDHKSSDVKMLADLASTLNSHHLEISDVSIEAVLDHILEKPASPSETAASPILVPLHISETNEWLLDQSPMRGMHLSRLMKAAYLFNKDMARSESGAYMLVITFDGTHRPELLESFEGSGVGCCLIQMESLSIQMYTDVLRGLAKKARLSNIECNQALHMFKPPEPLACAFADCGDNLRLFSMLLYKIGCYGNYPEKLGMFKWSRFLNNLEP